MTELLQYINKLGNNYDNLNIPIKHDGLRFNYIKKGLLAQIPGLRCNHDPCKWLSLIHI